MAMMEDPIKEKLKAWYSANCSDGLFPVETLASLVSVLRAIVAEEQEACAGIAEKYGECYSRAAVHSHVPLVLLARADVAFQIVYAIRARSRRADPVLYQQTVGRGTQEAFGGRGE